MGSRELTTDQATKLCDQLRPSLRYLLALRQRMEQRGFPPEDELRPVLAGAWFAYCHYVERRRIAAEAVSPYTSASGYIRIGSVNKLGSDDW